MWRCCLLFQNKKKVVPTLSLFKDTHRENSVFLNSVQEFTEIEAWLFLTFFSMFAQSINF